MLDIFLSPKIQHYLAPIKMIFIAFNLAGLAFIFFAAFRTRWFRFLIWYELVEFFTLEIYGGFKVRRQWHRILRNIYYLDPEECRKIIIDLHNTLDKLLLRLVPNFQANSFGERLARLGPATFSNLDTLWEVHEIYRSVVREDHQLTADEVKKSMAAYEQAFRDLEIL